MDDQMISHVGSCGRRDDMSLVRTEVGVCPNDERRHFVERVRRTFISRMDDFLREWTEWVQELRVSAIFPSNVPVFRCFLPSTGSPSRPGEFHPEPLTGRSRTGARTAGGGFPA